MTATEPQVGIILGSGSDWPQVAAAAQLLHHWGVAYEVTVASAHRSPARVQNYARQASARGLKVLIAAAGAAAHLAGVIASETILPVIGVPLAGSPLQGWDSLLATAQMPAGVPVAAMAVGTAGARNAAILATQILALSDERLRDILIRHKQDLVSRIEEQDAQLQAELAHSGLTGKAD
ncbi:MAG: 5-(carboxyamino)imidazole ribonucleotide mutase [Deltaproteobacteria bacterium]|nr:5-(carboxyamino)imidazole ribonucleotide mutase [Deltaproteobacteria bacterium]MBW2134085.1 5-(carboxyamino)imidazole ribonucleotide mutase [Deltaproteobacteria bacterium]